MGVWTIGPGRKRGATRAGVELACWLTLAAVAYALTFTFSDAAVTYAWGAAAWPRAVIVLIVIGATAQYLFEARTETATRKRPEHGAGGVRWRVLFALALPLVYVALLPHAGFYATTPFFLAGYLLVLGERRVPVLIAVAIATYAAIVTLFSAVFYVALPTGTWPGFYDLSNTLLSWLR